MTFIAPLHQIDFPDAEEIVSIAFSPDGSVLYVHAHQEVINLWALLVYGWPEIATGALGLVALALVWALIRVLRRPRRAGERYCRRCNYHLAGLPAAAAECPECGRGFGASGPAIGRRRLRRTAPAFIGLTAVGAAAAAVWSTSPVREGTVSGWFHWPSRWAFERWTACPVRETIDHVMAVDPATGTILRTVTRQHHPSRFELVLTPDGRHFFLAGGPARLLRICTETGRIVGSLELSVSPLNSATATQQWEQVIAVSSDNRRVYAAHADDHVRTGHVFEWNTATGERREIAEVGAQPLILSGTRSSMIPRFQLISDQGPVLISDCDIFELNRNLANLPRTITVYYKDGSGAEHSMEMVPQHATLIVYEGDGTKRLVSVPGGSYIHDFVLSPNLRTVYVPRARSRGGPLLGVEIASGEVCGNLEVPECLASSHIRWCSSEVLIGAAVGGLVLWPWNQPSKPLLLEVDPMSVGLVPRLSSDSKWVASIAVDRVAEKTVGVLIFDVTGHLRSDGPDPAATNP